MRNKNNIMKTTNIMKKFIFATTLLLVLTTVKTHAQSFMDRIHFEASAGIGAKNNGITPVDFSFKIHADVIPLAYVFVAVEDNLSLYKENGVKYYAKGVSLGGGLGVKLLNSTKTNHALDVRVKALGSLGSPDWKRTTYDAALAWYLKDCKFSPMVELGYRFLDSRTKGFDNYGNAYISIGLRY